MKPRSLTLRARYIFPVEGPPLAGGCLTIEEGRIGWIGPAGERKADLDLGNVAVTPGFVNAHTHLELSPLADGSNGLAAEDEVSWLRRVIAPRARRPELAGSRQSADPRGRLRRADRTEARPGIAD